MVRISACCALLWAKCHGFPILSDSNFRQFLDIISMIFVIKDRHIYPFTCSYRDASLENRPKTSLRFQEDSYTETDVRCVAVRISSAVIPDYENERDTHYTNR